MTSRALPFIECEQLHAGLAVSDIPTAVDFYVEKLGFFLAFTDGDPPTFAGVNLGHVQIFLQKGRRLPIPPEVQPISLSATPTSCTNSTVATVSTSRRRSTIGLEEMLLHTNEGVGPHTKTTLGYIQELKKKHGIDYDSHGSYRFVEE